MIHHAQATDTGLKRKNNQDSLLTRAEIGLFVVADGLGGHIGGEVASGIVTEYLQQLAPPGDAGAVSWLREAFPAANGEILARVEREPELQGMGSTCTALLLGENQAFVVHIGDSRAYLWRGGALTLLTSDHTVAQALVIFGELTPEEARAHPGRSQLTRVLGRRECRPSAYAGGRLPGDAWLLCSDGLYGVITDDEIAAWLAREDLSPDEVCQALVAAANDAGGPDNISAIFVRDGRPPAPGDAPPAPWVEIKRQNEAGEPEETRRGAESHQNEEISPRNPLHPPPDILNAVFSDRFDPPRSAHPEKHGFLEGLRRLIHRGDGDRQTKPSLSDRE